MIPRFWPTPHEWRVTAMPTTYLPSRYDAFQNGNISLSNEHKEVATDHFKLVHINAYWTQRLMRTHVGDEEPILPTKFPKSKSISLKGFHCTGCKCGKAHLQPLPSKKQVLIRKMDGALKQNNIRPGDMVSTDQYTSSVKGRRSYTAAKEKDYLKYCGGTLFINNVSELMGTNHQVSLGAVDTIQGKQTY